MEQKYEKNCFPIAFDLDKEFLFEEALKRPRKRFYYKGKVRSNYYYTPYEPNFLKKYIKNTFEIQGRWNMKFVYISPGANLDWHIDKGTKSSINWVINNSKAELQYRDKNYSYTSAILDTSKEHRVVNLKQERIIFKVSCFDMEYEQLCERFYKKFIGHSKKFMLKRPTKQNSRKSFQ